MVGIRLDLHAAIVGIDPKVGSISWWRNSHTNLKTILLANAHTEPAQVRL